MGHSGRSGSVSNVIMMVWLKRFQRRVLVRVPEIVLGKFWQRMWLSFTIVQKDLPEAKLENFKLMALAEESSRQPSIDSVLWLLVVTLRQVYNEMEQVEQGKI